MDPIEKVIKDFLLADRLLEGDENLQSEENLFKKGLIDSIRLFQLVIFLEERFEIVIPDHDVIADNFQSIDAIKNLVRSKSHSSG